MQRKKRFFTGAATIMALLMAVLVVLSGCDSDGGSGRRSRDRDDDKDRSPSYESVINRLVNAVQNEDGDAAIKLYSETLKNYYYDNRYIYENDDEFAKYTRDYFERIMENYEDSVGENIRLEVTECDFEEYDEDDFNKWIDEREDSEFDVDGITAFAEAEVTVNAKGKKKDMDYDWEFFMVKENGDWKIWSFYAEY